MAGRLNLCAVGSNQGVVVCKLSRGLPQIVLEWGAELYEVLLCMCQAIFPPNYQQPTSIGRSARRRLSCARDHRRRGSGVRAEIASLRVVSSELQRAETFVAVEPLIDIISPPHHH